MGQVIKRLEFLEIIIFCGIFPQCCLYRTHQRKEQGRQKEIPFAHKTTRLNCLIAKLVRNGQTRS